MRGGVEESTVEWPLHFCVSDRCFNVNNIKISTFVGEKVGVLFPRGKANRTRGPSKKLQLLKVNVLPLHHLSFRHPFCRTRVCILHAFPCLAPLTPFPSSPTSFLHRRRNARGGWNFTFYSIFEYSIPGAHFGELKCSGIIFAASLLGFERTWISLGCINFEKWESDPPPPPFYRWG